MEILIEEETWEINEHTGPDWIWVSEDKQIHAHYETDSSYRVDKYEWNGERVRDLIAELSIDKGNLHSTDLLDIKDKFEGFQWHIDFYAYRSNYTNGEIILLYGNVGSEAATKAWGFNVKEGKYRSTTIPINEGEYVSAFIDDSDEYIYVAVDSKIILGEIDNAGNMTILEDEMENPVSSLLRLN